MNTPRQHHYLPQSYQSVFQNKTTKEFAFLDMRAKDGEFNLKPSQPGAVGKEKDFYKMNVPPTGHAATYIENPFLSKLDGIYLRLLKQVTSPNFSDEQRLALSNYLAHLRCRTPAYFFLIGQVARKQLTKKIYDHILNNPDEFTRSVDAGFDLSTFESFATDFLAGPEFPIDRDFILQRFLAVSPKIATLINDAKWDVCLAEQGVFITSDNPFVLTTDASHNQIWIPLSSKVCLRMSNVGEKHKISSLPPEDVDIVNEAIAYHAERWILGESPEALESAYKRSRRRMELDALLDALTGP